MPTPDSYKMVSRSLFLFPVYKRHFAFYGDYYLSVSGIHPSDCAPPKSRYSRWNFTEVVPNGRFYYFRS